MALARILRLAGLGLALTAGVGSAAVLYLLRRSLPSTRGRVRLKGISSKVEVLRDRWGVPHVYAANLHDLMFGFGYAQAQDRFWQLEFYRRLAAGTLAEVMGEAALEFDRLARRIGFQRVAQRDWDEANETERAVLEAFSAGVNAYMESSRLPVEFMVLRYRPQRWRPEDTIAFGRFLAWSFSGNWDSEIVRSWTIERFGSEVAQDTEPGCLPGAPLVVPPGVGAKGAGPSLEGEFRKVEELIAATGRALSNNWAVDGEKSVTGKPILASDPHLPLQIPSIWYQVHLDSPNLKVAGACMPGLPEIFIGHNDRIAWGVTAALADGDDLFVERINPDNPRQYEFQGQWLEAEVVREEITVRGRRKPLIEEVMITRHGPIISPCIRAETRTLALRTTALEPAHQLEAAIELMVAQDWEQFHQALRGWLVSPLNFAYADVDGNIGYQLAGLIPMRAKGYGMVPSPGWTGEYEWTGFIPFDELPNAYNPDRHWLASSNNKIVDEDYPHFLTYSYDNGYRQQRIAQLLEAKERLSSDDFKEIQTDVYSIPGVELASYILGLQPRDEWCRRAQTFVKAWDHRATADSVAACIVETFFSHLVRRALREKLGSWSEFYLGRGIHPAQPTGHFYFAAAGWLLEKIQSRPDWFSGMTWQAAMEESLASAVAELRRLLGDDMSRWQWGRLHLQSFRHVLGQSPPLDRVFNRGPVSLGGNCSTVWQAAYVPHTGYQVGSWTASYRQIVDLSDFNRSLAVMPTGQSGHPGSRHYADMIEMWRKGEYHPMPWDRSQVEAVVEAQLTLEPPAGDGAARGAETA